MKNTPLWLGLALLSAAPLTPQPVFAAPPTPTLVSKSEGFSVWLPGKAQIGQRTQQMAGAGAMTVKYYTARSSSVGFVVIPMNLPAVLPSSKTKQFLHGVQIGLTRASGAKLVSAKNISLNGVPGREIVVNAGGNRIQARCYAIGKRSYQVLAVAPQKAAASQAPLIAKVFNSFKILR